MFYHSNRPQKGGVVRFRKMGEARRLRSSQQWLGFVPVCGLRMLLCVTAVNFLRLNQTCVESFLWSVIGGDLSGVSRCLFTPPPDKVTHVHTPGIPCCLVSLHLTLTDLQPWELSSAGALPHLPWVPLCWSLLVDDAFSSVSALRIGLGAQL